ncbi:hypothetical protein [Salinispora mooreana]|uniref:hypothetical protein n=1 Tax=Salinispora mooreana TaxID=999545 RepID=UPI0003711D81|nr:hypothetical protein [Salinispora mooreana]
MPFRALVRAVTFRPDYQLFTLRDIDSDAGVGAGEAIASAIRDIAACTGYELYVKVVQDLLPVTVTVEIWDTSPGPTNPSANWSPTSVFRLQSPTGQLVLSAPTGDAFDGIDPPSGPGTYAIDVHHRGRQEADDARQKLLQDTTRLDEPGARPSLEHYLLRMWPGS